MDTATRSQSTIDETDVTARWQWLGVVGAGLIAAAITAIAMPFEEHDAASAPTPAPTATHGNAR